MSPTLPTRSNQCPACNAHHALDWAFVHLPGGKRQWLGTCDRCNYCPNLEGYLKQSRIGGCRLEAAKRQGPAYAWKGGAA